MHPELVAPDIVSLEDRYVYLLSLVSNSKDSSWCFQATTPFWRMLRKWLKMIAVVLVDELWSRTWKWENIIEWSGSCLSLISVSDSDGGG
jgi:hypothetical protein